MILAKDEIIQMYVAIDANTLATINATPAETMAIREDVLPLIGQELYDAIRSRVQSTYKADGTTVRQPGDHVYYEGKVYEVITASSTLPYPTNPNYYHSELMQFWYDVVAPIFCYSFGVFLVTRHGTNITRFNLSNQSGDRFSQVSGSDRAVLIAQYKGLLRSEYNRARSRLILHGATFDAVQYALPIFIKKYEFNIF